MPFMLARKIEMSNLFDTEGNAIPVTVLQAGPLAVTQVKNKETDGYEAVQVGFVETKEKKLRKPQEGHLIPAGVRARHLREFKDKGEFKVGDKIEISVFKEGDMVDIRARVKGRGFQGVVKRHGFHGGPRTHGQKHSEREPGSIGATWPQRVLKGKRMAGRMGGNAVTVKNLKIVKVEPEQNLLYVRGAVPGARGALLELKSVR
ncbi:MAG: 50S ribosomal protein L3 [Candidatus Giovannonibacteria bacterium GW2011_GWA2_53_7]|uniref:Large ribosomal subunit protein uL3 n=1 Tax=Candidatus Giovannonibacteria bacterium GW2011_GWA2_53_7 TaxID=1618650 RepID=A0A0G1Y0C5_9BACT|nr:MAG: 50S ribosomal protein L3 [Candidatus Giovannonibacteria bacterium GW2011_GWA2_53_7]